MLRSTDGRSGVSTERRILGSKNAGPTLADPAEENGGALPRRRYGRLWDGNRPRKDAVVGLRMLPRQERRAALRAAWDGEKTGRLSKVDAVTNHSAQSGPEARAPTA